MLRVFLDASVLLGAAGSAKGASHALFSYASNQMWTLQSSPYALNEVLRNLKKLPSPAVDTWKRLRSQIAEVEDIVSLDLAVVFPATKDRPILFTAFAWSDMLLTLDKADFASIRGGEFYGLRVLMPHEFLRLERSAGRLHT